MIVIGCPVRKREWILPLWKEHLDIASKRAFPDYDIFYSFVVGKDDKNCIDIISSWDNANFRIVEENPKEDVRAWNDGAYVHMAELRNSLLEDVREINPEFFFSIDSDMLMHEDSLVNMLDTYHNHDAWAVGGKAYLSMGGRNHPTFGNWINPSERRSFKRFESDQVISVDILMAIKMMDSRAYNIDYSYHKSGEDLGWSSNINASGGKLWWDGRITNKHVMSPSLLGSIDVRCGY